MTRGGRSRVVAAVVLGAGLAASAPPAAGQGRLEIGVGVGAISGYQIGGAEATLTANTGSGGGEFTLFSIESELETAIALDLRLGWRLSRIFAVEAGLGYATPNVATQVTGDVEAGSRSFDTALSQWIIDGSVVVHLTALEAVDGRLRPFLVGGLGYLRQLDDGSVLVASGRAAHAGGGVKYALWNPADSWIQRVGVRAELRLLIRNDGFDLEDRRRTSVTGHASVFLAVF
ncbi:MAG: hypothetical protein QGG24_10400 [Vicinamibacterales bacterium]|nr:hypothetical protein [Acidobacteriota bacterium]MDP7295719.1 hypothetical protein [Vicinamibacterales bacterium]MDP7671032.1 hypothetical protein [Vicinamibacterales bacterium]HJO38723.1 hypothetical protein [Vicinamibacterales bacterium]